MMKSLFPVTNNDFLFPDHVFNSFFNDFMKPSDGSYSIPKVDIEDTDKAYILTTDLPGVAKEDINVTYDDNVLTLSAKHEETKEEKDAKEKKNYIRKERTSNVFCRQFSVQNIQKEGIQASFENGVLTITLPKEEPQQVEAKHTIEIQ